MLARGWRRVPRAIDGIPGWIIPLLPRPSVAFVDRFRQSTARILTMSPREEKGQSLAQSFFERLDKLERSENLGHLVRDVPRGTIDQKKTR